MVVDIECVICGQVAATGKNKGAETVPINDAVLELVSQIDEQGQVIRKLKSGGSSKVCLIICLILYIS